MMERTPQGACTRIRHFFFPFALKDLLMVRPKEPFSPTFSPFFLCTVLFSRQIFCVYISPLAGDMFNFLIRLSNCCPFTGIFVLMPYDGGMSSIGQPLN